MTTPPASRYARLRSRLLGLAALFAAAVLSVYYFRYDDSLTDVRRQWGMFYPNLRPGWALLRESEIDYAFNTNPDMWTTLAVRTAYGRWRLRNVAPEAFDQIMDDYDRGWWLSPNRDVWEKKFSEYDSNWIAERQGRLADPKGIEDRTRAVVEQTTTNTLLIRFPGRPLTADTGTLLRLIVDATPNEAPTAPIYLYWETEKASGRASQRRRMATWHLVDGAPEGKQRVIVEVDLSWEPVWMYSESRVRGLHYRAPSAERWTFVRMEFGDSPLLRPASESSRPSNVER